MKKQIVKSISILSLLVLLSVSSVNVLASGGTCSIPSCRPKMKVTKPSEPNLYKQESGISEQPKESFGFGYFLVQWAMIFLY